MTVPLPGAHILLAALLFSPVCFALDGSRLKQRADAVLTLMSYTVVPDITASDLNIGSGNNESHELSITQFGGGATLSESFPLYLEGTMSYSRYDPQFILTNGDESRKIPTKWNSVTASGGIGWDFHLYTDKSIIDSFPFLCVSLFVISEAKFLEIMQMLATMLQRDSTSMDVNVML